MRAQAIERPIPPASDFGGQVTSMLGAFDLLDKMKSRFQDTPTGDDDEPAWMVMVERLMPMLLPQSAAAPAPALPAPAAQTNPATVHAPLDAADVQNARQMLAPLAAINPAMTLERLCELGERAGIAHRQSVHLFHGVMGVLNGGQTTVAPGADEEHEEDEYSEEEESWSEEESDDRDDQAPELPTPAEPTPAAPTLLAPPLSGPESTPAGQKPASGPSDSSPPSPPSETTRAVG